MANSILLAVLVFVGAMSIFYWTVTQPILLRKYVYRMFALRDRLRWALIREDLDRENEHVRTLERIIGVIIANASKMSMLHFLWFCLTTRNDGMDKDVERFLSEAPPLIQELNNSAMEASFTILLINAPVFYLCSVALYACVAILRLSIPTPRQKRKELAARESENGRVGAFVSGMPDPAHA